MRKQLLTVVLAACLASWVQAQQVAQAPTQVVRFAVIGDNGTGERPQFEIGERMAAARAEFPFEFVVMVGDNMYGRQQPQDFVDKFQRPYGALLTAGVSFYAALGNHDDQDQRFYKPFNMGGQRYYTFEKGEVRFFVLDTNLMDDQQFTWFRQALASSQDRWKIAVFHHPLYSDGGRHGANVDLRVLLEPELVRNGISAVFSGHDHIYERLKPQKGITYFVEGSSGQLRRGDLDQSDTTASGFDQDQTFMLIQIEGDQLSFRAIARNGRVVDSGVVTRRSTT